MISSTIFGMDQEQASIGWEDLPDYVNKQPASVPDILEDIAPTMCDDKTYSVPLVPPLPIPSFSTMLPHKKASSVSSRAPAAVNRPRQQPTIGNIEEDQLYIVNTLEQILTAQNRHIELMQLLAENTQQLQWLNQMFMIDFSTLSKKYRSIEPQAETPREKALDEHLINLLTRGKLQQTSMTSMGTSASFLQRLLKMQFTMMQQFAQILQIELKEKP